MMLAAACGGSAPTSPSETARLTERIVTPHFVFHYSANDSVDTEWQGIAPMRRLLARRGRAALAGVPRFVTHPAPRTSHLAPALVTSQNQLYALSV